MYSDVAYFGDGYYGLQAASCGYFGVAREAHVLGRLAAAGTLTRAQAGRGYQQSLHLSDSHTSSCAA